MKVALGLLLISATGCAACGALTHRDMCSQQLKMGAYEIDGVKEVGFHMSNAIDISKAKEIILTKNYASFNRQKTQHPRYAFSWRAAPVVDQDAGRVDSVIWYGIDDGRKDLCFVDLNFENVDHGWRFEIGTHSRLYVMYNGYVYSYVLKPVQVK